VSILPGKINSEKSDMSVHEPGRDPHLEHDDPIIRLLHRIIWLAVKIHAVLMVIVIICGIGDVIYVFRNSRNRHFYCFKITIYLQHLAHF
jgi:hypothetical protein